MILVSTVLLASALLLLRYCFLKWISPGRRWFVAEVNKLPGRKGNFLFGNALEFRVPREDLFKVLVQMLSDFGEYPLGNIWLASRPIAVLLRAEAVEVLLGPSDNLDKNSLYRFFYPWLGLGLLTSTGEKWHRRRKMLTPSFHFKILQDFVDVFNEHGIKLVSKLEQRSEREDSFDVYPYLSRCTLDIICETAMQKSVNAQDDSESVYVQAVNDIADIINKRCFFPWLQPEWIFRLTSYGWLHKHCLKIMHGFTNSVIVERRRDHVEGSDITSEENTIFGRKKRQAFLDTLLSCSENGKILSNESIREEVDTFMFEGHDTTSSGLCWILFILGHHPEIQQKVHEELDSIFGDSDRHVTSDDLKEMKYLECTIKEAFRLYPPVPLFGRQLTKPIHIGQYTVPAGIDVMVCCYTLHRDPRYFPDPERCDPDRFLPENSSKRNPYAYVPFSAGPRNCIGQKFALMEVKITIAHLMRRFRVMSLQSRDEIKLLAELILRPASGLLINLQNRRPR